MPISFDQLTDPRFVLVYVILLFLRPLYIVVCGVALRVNRVAARDIATWSRRYAEKRMFDDLLDLACRRGSARHAPPQRGGEVAKHAEHGAQHLR